MTDENARRDSDRQRQDETDRARDRERQIHSLETDGQADRQASTAE